MSDQETVTGELQDQDDTQFSQDVFRNFMDQWVTPEVVRRQGKGELPRPLDLQRAQVIFYADGRKPVIRINGEVKGKMSLDVIDGVTKAPGDTVFANEVTSIGRIALSDDDDADAGHMTFVRIGNRWHGQFDFIYNKGVARRHLDRALEFLSAAEHAFERQHVAACADNLFSTAELLAKANLLLLAEVEFRAKSSHRSVSARFNHHARLGNIEARFRYSFNQLGELRYPARYLDKDDPRLDVPTTAGHLAVVKDYAAELRRQLSTLEE